MGEFIIKYWIEFILSCVVGILSFTLTRITQQFKKEIEDQKALKLGIQAMLRDRLIQAYNRHTRKGFCSIQDRDNITNLYEQYHSLGVNGVMDGLYEEMMELPVREDC